MIIWIFETNIILIKSKPLKYNEAYCYIYPFLFKLLINKFLPTYIELHITNIPIALTINQTKLVKPLIEQPYIPTEVNNLEETVSFKKIPLSEMTNAEIIGLSSSNVTQPKEEKPTIYSTVIHQKETSITRTKPVQSSLINNNQHLNQLSPGTFSIPIKMDSNQMNDPNLRGYVTPNFKKSQSNNEHTKLTEILNNDLNLIINGIKNDKKNTIMNQIITKLKTEQNELKQQIKNYSDKVTQYNILIQEIKDLLSKFKIKYNH